MTDLTAVCTLHVKLLQWLPPALFTLLPETACRHSHAVECIQSRGVCMHVVCVADHSGHASTDSLTCFVCCCICILSISPGRLPRKLAEQHFSPPQASSRCHMCLALAVKTAQSCEQDVARYCVLCVPSPCVLLAYCYAACLLEDLCVCHEMMWCYSTAEWDAACGPGSYSRLQLRCGSPDCH